MAKSKYNLNVFKASLKNFVSKRKEKFNIITAFEVLEHQDKPLNFLNDVYTLLEKEGFFCGSVPNRNRIFVEIHRKINNFDYPPHHFLYFNKESLKNALINIGFKEIEIIPTSTSLGDFLKYLSPSLFYLIFRDRYFLLKRYFKTSKKSSYDNNFNGSNIRINIFQILRNYAVFPLALILYPLYKIKGHALFFCAKK